MDLPTLIQALQRPGAYPVPPAEDVEVVQTHISVLFFAGARVYKIKKPVRTSFLDYTTLERRRHFCEEEVRLNRRLAPTTYLGVARITRTTDGTVQVDGDGAVIDYAVEMVRLPEDRLLDALLRRGEVDDADIDAIARHLAEYHASCRTGPEVEAFAAPDELVRQVDENAATLTRFVAENSPFPRLLHTHLVNFEHEWLESGRPLLERRIADGRVREGHGDLHAGNICLTPDGIVIYDCIEFAERYRCRDVACEMAFLAMDLDAQGYVELAERLLRRYAELTDDPDLPTTATFYRTHLAMVRGMVAFLRADDVNLPEPARGEARCEAARYLHLAAGYTLPPMLMLMCGLPASGKSHAARLLARPLRARILRTDVIRKTLVRAEGISDEDLYTAACIDRTYAATLTEAISTISRGRTAVVDATFATRALRAPFIETAHRMDVPLLLVEMRCSDAVTLARLAARAHDPDEVSDADLAVYEDARERFEAPTEVTDDRRLIVTESTTAEEIESLLIDSVIAESGVLKVKTERLRPPGGP